MHALAVARTQVIDFRFPVSRPQTSSSRSLVECGHRRQRRPLLSLLTRRRPTLSRRRRRRLRSRPTETTPRSAVPRLLSKLLRQRRQQQQRGRERQRKKRKKKTKEMWGRQRCKPWPIRCTVATSQSTRSPPRANSTSCSSASTGE